MKTRNRCHFNPLLTKLKAATKSVVMSPQRQIITHLVFGDLFLVPPLTLYRTDTLRQTH